MKYFVLTLILFCCSEAFTQECDEHRWIALQRSANNTALFVDMAGNSENELWEVIKKQVMAHKLKLYEAKDEFRALPHFQMLLGKEITVDSKESAGKDPSIQDFSDYFRTHDVSNSPLKNVDGEDSLAVINEVLQFIYPSIERALISEDIKEIRILERKVNGVYQPEKIGFYIRSFYHEADFWVDIRELLESLTSSDNYTWTTVLKNKTYSGFQYRQWNETTCNEKRYIQDCRHLQWISLKNTSANNPLFTPDANGLLKTIAQLSERGDLELYHEVTHSNTEQLWYNIAGMQHDLYNKKHEYTYDLSATYDSTRTDYVRILDSETLPYVNLYGEDSMHFEGGILHFVYPPPAVYRLNTSAITEIRIKEEVFVLPGKEGYGIRPVGISFLINHNGNLLEPFWVDLERLFALVKESEEKPWVQLLKDRKYIGYQFLQTNCGETFIRW